YRLASSKIKLKNKIKEDQDIVIPWRALDEFQKIISAGSKQITLILGKNQAIFKLDDIILISRLLEGQFPNYQQLLPTEFTITAEIRREDLVAAVTRASLIAQKNQSVKLNLTDKKLTISAQSAGIGETTEDLGIKSTKGTEIEIAFNSQYLLDGAASVSTDTVILELNNSVSPGLIKSLKNNDSLYLIMPIRVN
ncbi:MAG TPA: DNA polymerase III subunit beta, partial [Actinobacteria bacterium]|nr:DNA polymerase III subunit beta [Actinomycetes bacterium]HEX21313.1 DNA polymerase III subunit beta [Actinomycetota bacterium]